MYEHKEKSAVSTAMPTAEKENIYSTNIAQVSEKSKYVCTDFLKLNQYQKITIKAVYRHSKSVFELVDGLNKLQFCDFKTAIQMLIAMGYITKSDGDYLVRENIEIRRK